MDSSLLWITSKRTHRLLWLTFKWFCGIMMNTDFSEEIDFFSNVDPEDNELYPPNMKTYSKKQVPKEIIGRRKCNILNVPQHLLTPHNSSYLMESFVSSCISKEQALNWLHTWYSKDDMACKDTWEIVSQNFMKHVYGVENPKLDFPYKIKVVYSNTDNEKKQEDQFKGWKIIEIPAAME